MQNDHAYLVDILESAKIAISYLEKTPFEDFVSSIQIQDAVIRRLEMIGEASSRISMELQKTHSDLPWEKMKSMRNFLIHEYDDIDFKIVWDTVKNNLPPLIVELQKILPL
jgi:uncharacterized protein with HEPN domain